jgi:hypothetical protein
MPDNVTSLTIVTAQEIEELVSKLHGDAPEWYRAFVRDQKDAVIMSETIRRIADELYCAVAKVGPLNIILSSIVTGMIMGRYLEAQLQAKAQKTRDAWGSTPDPLAEDVPSKPFDPDAERNLLERLYGKAKEPPKE